MKPDLYLNVKEGVIFKKITSPILNIINEVLKVWTYYNSIPTITSANDSKHLETSLHYKDMAIDLRIKDIPTDKVSKVFNLLKQSLGKDYDVVLEVDHIHAEYDPK